MRIVFMGTPDFAVPSLKALVESGYDIPAVVTVPDKPQGRGLKTGHSAVKQFAFEHNIKVLQPVKLKDENFISELKSLDADLFIVVAFRILPKEVYTIPKLGSFNLHASLLPKYRGAAPINWAIINGEKETGVTTFFLQDKVDTGNIILQKKCSITEDETAGTLHDKLCMLGSDAVLETVKIIESSKGDTPTMKQDDSLSSPAPKIFPDMCKVHFDKHASEVHNFIRGLSPHPSAYTFYEGKRFKILLTAPVEGSDFSPNIGTVRIEKDRMFVQCKDSEIELLEVQLEGKKRMTAGDFLRGNAMKDGHRFN